MTNGWPTATTRPFRINPAAFRVSASETKFSVPRSSFGPHRPAFERRAPSSDRFVIVSSRRYRRPAALPTRRLGPPPCLGARELDRETRHMDDTVPRGRNLDQHLVQRRGRVVEGLLERQHPASGEAVLEEGPLPFLRGLAAESRLDD